MTFIKFIAGFIVDKMLNQYAQYCQYLFIVLMFFWGFSQSIFKSVSKSLICLCILFFLMKIKAALSPQGSWNKERLEEGRRHCDRLRDLAALAEKLGCTPTQLSIAWSLKHEPVQCLLLGATSAEQLHQSLQSLQVSRLLLYPNFFV